MLAATAADTGAAINTLLLIGAVLVVGYLISCRFKPFTHCGGCHGTGKRGGAKFRTCGRCKGAGSHERLGHRLMARARD